MTDRLRSLLRCGAGAALLGVALLGAGAAAIAADPAARAPATIYARTCGYCHGHNDGPIILGRALPPALVTLMVRNGRGAMPAFRPTEIGDAELAGLAAWIAASPAAAEEHGK